MGFPQQSRGALFTALTCPVYAQRLMLFANHILWKLTNGARHATLRICQLPSQQLAISLTVCGSIRKQLSLSICLAVTFSNTCDLCLHAWGLSSLRGLPSSLWTDKTPTLLLKIKRGEGKKDTPGITSFSVEAILSELYGYISFSHKDNMYILFFLNCGLFFLSLPRLRVQNAGPKTRPVYSPLFSHHGWNLSLNIRTEKHLCGVDVTDLPGLLLTKAKVSLARLTQWPFNQATALLRTWEQCYFLSQHYKDRVLQETWQTEPFRGKCSRRLLGLIFSH